MFSFKQVEISTFKYSSKTPRNLKINKNLLLGTESQLQPSVKLVVEFKLNLEKRLKRSENSISFWTQSMLRGVAEFALPLNPVPIAWLKEGLFTKASNKSIGWKKDGGIIWGVWLFNGFNWFKFAKFWGVWLLNRFNWFKFAKFWGFPEIIFGLLLLFWFPKKNEKGFWIWLELFILLFIWFLAILEKFSGVARAISNWSLVIFNLNLYLFLLQMN